ncbi:hypothetical protein JCM10003_2402 [Bacteroides pyogenes JCM 10003]|nr:hypothetical protein JCM10003_2402 [Bacteroides pyogenes JCM 10003]
MAQTVEREKAIHPGGDGEPAVIAAEIKAVKRHDKASCWLLSAAVGMPLTGRTAG